MLLAVTKKQRPQTAATTHKNKDKQLRRYLDDVDTTTFLMR